MPVVTGYNSVLLIRIWIDSGRIRTMDSDPRRQKKNKNKEETLIGISHL
jgi:hypothetical protein